MQPSDSPRKLQKISRATDNPVPPAESADSADPVKSNTFQIDTFPPETRSVSVVNPIPLAQPMVAAGGPPQNASSFDPMTLLAAFRRRWFLATSLGILVGAIAAGIVYQLVPAPYTAYAELHVSSVQEKILFTTAEVVTHFNIYKQTQMRMVVSPFVMAAALRNPAAANLSIVKQQPHPAQWLESQIKVSSPATEFIRVSMSGDDPAALHQLVNAVSEAYMQEVVNSEQAARAERKTNLERIFRDIDEKMSKKKTAMRRLAESLNTGDSQTLTVRQQMAVEYFGQLRKAHAEVRFELTRKRIQLEARRSIEVSEKPIEIPELVVDARISQHPEIQQLTKDAAMAAELLRRTEDRLSGDDHPLIVESREKLAALETSLEVAREELRPAVVEELLRSVVDGSETSESQMEKEIELLAAEEQQLAAELDSQKLEARQIGIASFELESLKDEIAQMDSVAKSLSSEIQKLSIELQTDSRVSLHRASELPHAPDVSKKHKLTAVAGFGGFGSVVAVLIWLELLSRRISATHEVADGLGLRILGSLPIMPSWMTNGKPAGKSSNKARRAIMRSVWTESVDAARTVLLRDSNTESTRAIMIASAMGSEGKTTLSCHLATSLARGGQRTLLLDTDMRRPSVHKVFGLSPAPGFCELLRDEVEIDEVIQSVDQDGLSVITAGKINQATLRALAKEGTEGILAELRKKFDVIIVDSAPVLPVTDSLLVGQKVDGVVFSIRRDHSRFGKVTAACQKLSMLNIPIIGAVVTGLDESAYGYRYPYRYGYGYGYGYGGYGYNASSSADVVR